MLDSFFSQARLASRGSRSRRNHAATRAQDVEKLTRLLPSPMVPAALHGTVMQGRQTSHRYVGVDISCPAVDADSVSVTPSSIVDKGTPV